MNDFVNERRLDERVDRELDIEVSLASYQKRLLTGNVSSSGVFLKVDDEDDALSPQTIIKLKLAEGKDSATILGRIVWAREEGMGIKFLNKNDAIKLLKG